MILKHTASGIIAVTPAEVLKLRPSSQKLVHKFFRGGV